MNIRLIKNEADYEQALLRLEALFDAPQDSPQGDELEILSLLIDQYEKENYPIDLPDPIEAIKFRLEQLGYSQNDLAEIIGLKSRASEILSKKRKLSLRMIRQIHARLHIPTDVLIQSY
ncbi:helix-turn-helix domain-containing protein [Parabacteroides sp. PF5-6]|uniref:helix-turn-helix domain-containing protein n=1 Tax=Parabacteroides sp. PF5-6 TaxID=1742403 RepID=UPI0024060A68|nr:helix-turn-helix domain-containing protein [Parabacteroides sp. PF5-6]MDF9829998.1 HTH-type transcriptional regulator/antitoxin HigA [Parabacteroides sp. PF5-6]